MDFFTSDHHLGHFKICEYADRPFDGVAEMDLALIDAWNGAVGPSDTVYHMGDFCLGSTSMAGRYFSLLNGTICILAYPWHHDRLWLPVDGSLGVPTASSHAHLRSSMVVLEYREHGDGKYPLHVVLCHYPIARWDRSHYGSIHLHGHSHGRFSQPGRSLDVGVDSAYKLTGKYQPLSLDFVLEYMKDKEMHPPRAQWQGR